MFAGESIRSTSILFQVLQNNLTNTYAVKAARYPEKYSHWLTVRDTCDDILQSWCLRLHNIHNKPPSLMRFSLLLDFYNCPTVLWNILSHLRLSFSKSTTLRLANILASVPIENKLQWKTDQSIAVIGADNMGYYTHVAQVRVDPSTGIVKTNTWLDTINWWQRWDYPSIYPPFLSSHHLFHHIRDLSSTQKSLSLSTSMMFSSFNTAYSHAITQLNSKLTLLDRPPDSLVTLPSISYQSPMFHLKTSTYVDMKVFLNKIYLKYLRMSI